MLRKAPIHRPDVGEVITFTGDAAALDRKYRRGWRIADGTDGTPNLIDVFPKFDTFANKGLTGGAKTVTPAGSVTVANRTLTVSQIPSHAHSYSHVNGANTNNGGHGLGADSPLQSYTSGSEGGSSSHNHGGTFSGTSHSNEPQFFNAVPLYFTGVPGTYGA